MKALTDRNDVSLGRNPAHYNLIVSSGGTRAVLAGAGTIVAGHLAGIEWGTIGGVSGGSIPTALLASGTPAPQLLRHAMAVDFSRLVDWEGGLCKSILAFATKDYHEHVRNRPATGILNTEKLGAFIDSHANQTWPEKYWTMAAAGDSQILFNKDGVFEITLDGRVLTLSDKPAPLGLAVRASCTIPGIISAVSYQNRYLFDGALTRDGICPVGVKIRHFGLPASKIIASCVGEDFMHGIAGYLRRAWRSMFKMPPNPEWGPETVGVIDLHTHFSHMHALTFKLSSDDKWLAILHAFSCAILGFAEHKVLTGEKLDLALNMLVELEPVFAMKPARANKAQLLSDKAASVFAKYGLYDLSL